MRTVRSCGLVIAFGMLLHAQTARAASECEQNYTSVPGSQGGVIHQSFVGLYGDDKATATAKLKAMAKSSGFQTIGETGISSDGLVSMVVAQKASETARGFPIVMMVSPATDSAVIAFELPAGMTAPDARGSVCSFFKTAGLEGKPANASGRNAARNSVLALPLLSALNGGNGVDQAARDAVASSRQAGAGAGISDRGAAPEIADRRKVVKPKAIFNPADADPDRLSEGSSTIRGLTCGRVMVVGGSQYQAAHNQKILLFPYTPYLQEAIDLVDANRNKSGKVRVDVDKRAFAVQLEGVTNDKGAFQFTRVKPGRYLVMAAFSGSASGVQSKPQSSYDGSTNTVYTWTQYEQWSTSSTDILQADVTISRDGQVVEGVVVKPRGNGRFLPMPNGICKLHLQD